MSEGTTMAWPKGRRRTPKPVDKPVEAVAQRVSAPPAPELEHVVDIVAMRRRICAYRVRQQQVPREIRLYDWLPLGKLAVRIRREMQDCGAPDSEVEAFVAKHVRA